MSLPAYAMGRASFPELYEKHLVGPLFRPWVEDLLQRASLSPGCRMLDLACGTGIVARMAKARIGSSGRVVGVDLAAPMLELARRIEPGVEWREGDASALPFAAGETFDAVVCQQGYQFFGDRPAAAREIRRVLAPGGRAVVATWLTLEEIPLFRDINRAAEKHLGPVADARYSLSAATLERELAEAGLEPRIETLRKTLRLEDPGTFLRLNAMALVGMSAAGKSLDEAGRERAVAEVAQESAAIAEPYVSGGGLVLELGTTVATATAL